MMMMMTINQLLWFRYKVECMERKGGGEECERVENRGGKCVGAREWDTDGEKDKLECVPQANIVY